MEDWREEVSEKRELDEAEGGIGDATRGVVSDIGSMKGEEGVGEGGKELVSSSSSLATSWREKENVGEATLRGEPDEGGGLEVMMVGTSNEPRVRW